MNIKNIMEFTEEQPQQPQPQPQPNVQTRLVDIEVKDENVALNLLVSFLSVAQKRGTFAIDESAKIYECIKLFSKNK